MKYDIAFLSVSIPREMNDSKKLMPGLIEIAGCQRY